MLVVTTTMRMVHGVHSNTTSTRPVVTLGPVLVERTTSFQEGLVNPSSTSNDTNGSPSVAANSLLCARWETDSGLVVIRGVTDDGGIVAGSAGKGTAVTDFLLDVADNGTLGKSGDGEDIADGESSLLSAVHKCTGVEALSRDEGLLTELVAVGVTENDAGKGSTTAGIMDDVLYNTPDVAIALCEVERAQTSRVLVQVRVRFEDSVRAPLCPNNPTHFM